MPRWPLWGVHNYVRLFIGPRRDARPHLSCRKTEKSTNSAVGGVIWRNPISSRARGTNHLGTFDTLHHAPVEGRSCDTFAIASSCCLLLFKAVNATPTKTGCPHVCQPTHDSTR
jgi:hypothetical protein